VNLVLHPDRPRLSPSPQIHGLLLVDKDRGMSSHDVVARARRALQTKRVGHIGTLDPMATGLLVLAIGEATKLVAHLTEHDKHYTCTVRLGVETASLDADGSPTSSAPVPPLTPSLIEELCRDLEARTSQVPPVVSAIRVDGERSYTRARRGETVALPARVVQLHSLALVALRPNELELSVHCGKGFYVRALARDLAYGLGTVGHLVELRRTHIGADDVRDAVDSTLLEQASRGDDVARATIRQRVIPLQQACDRIEQVLLNEVGADHASHGRAVPHECVEGVLPAVDRVVVLLDDARRPVALGRVLADAIKISRGFVRDETEK